MKAYKFRSVENFHFILDIILNRRLYCSTVEQLNDFREANAQMGNQMAGTQQEMRELLEFSEKAMKEVNCLKVCALSKTYKKHLLWGHYAGGYKGVAIEVELDESEITNIAYEKDYRSWSDLIKQCSPEEAARKLLSSKFDDWVDEEEVRVISRSEYYSLSRPITRIIVGAKTERTVIDALSLICSDLGIGLERMQISESGITTAPILN